MYICVDCGFVFEETEVDFESYNHADHGDRPAVEEWACCPACKGAFTDAVKCKMCENWFDEVHLFGGVCDKCIEVNSDFDTCLNVGSRHRESVRLNSFLFWLFDEDEIEQILTREARGSKKIVDCRPFVEYDKDWFGESLLSVKEGE